jgi:aquaporin Z
MKLIHAMYYYRDIHVINGIKSKKIDMMDMGRTKLSLILKNKMSLNQKKFLAEVIGTFIVVVLATGSVVVDVKMGGSLGLPFIVFAPFVGVVVGVYLFGRISMAHFNPAVTLGFLITKHISKRMFFLYVFAEVTGALLASLFVSAVIGAGANLGANSPNYSYPLPLVFGVEVLASALLMTVVLVVVHKKGLRGFGGMAVGGMVVLDILFLGFISGASMNPARSLAPALMSHVMGSLWLYWSATFVGTSIIAAAYRKKFSK